MGQEIIYCSRCQEQLRSADFEKDKAFRVDGTACCSKCFPELLKSLAPDKLKLLAKHLESQDVSSKPRSHGTPAARIQVPAPSKGDRPPTEVRNHHGPSPSTRRQTVVSTGRRRILVAGGILTAVVVILLVGVPLSGRRSGPANPQATPSTAETKEPQPPSPPAGPSSAPPLQTSNALVEAREFARKNPNNFRAQFAQFERAVKDLDGLAAQQEARLEIKNLRARSSEAVSAALPALEEVLRSSLRQEKYAEASVLLDSAGARFPADDWSKATEGLTRLIRDSANDRYAILKEQALEARRRGAESDVQTIRVRIEQWGVSDLTADLKLALDRTLASARTAPEESPKAPTEKPPPTSEGTKVEKKDGLAPPTAPVPMSLVLTAPLPGVEFTSPATIVLIAEVKGDVAKVEFYHDSKKIGEATAPPYEYAWKSVRTGTYLLSAKAIAVDGSGVAAEPVRVSVTLFGKKAPPKVVAGHPKVDQKRLDEVIKKGVEYLRTAGTPSGGYAGECVELVLLTLIHAGVPESDPYFQLLIKKMLSAPMEHTYNVSAQAMVLERLDRVRFQKRIYHCAQFLVDNQQSTGMWNYGAPTRLGELPPGVPVREKKPTGSSKERPPTDDGKHVVVRFPVTKDVTHRSQLGGGGDPSNSQYAALGLRACHDAGIIIPREVIEMASRSWRGNQIFPEGSMKSGDVPTGTNQNTAPGGWNYTADGRREGRPSGSMTVGAVGALAIYDYILEKNWKNDPELMAGVNWISKNFTVTTNPAGEPGWLFYYLYALERAGMLLSTDYFGKNEWYPEGANFLMNQQRADGSWSTAGPSNPAFDTCFAILFLRRATRPLMDVASVDATAPKK